MIDCAVGGAKIVNSHPRRDEIGHMVELKGGEASVPTLHKHFRIHVVQDLERLRFPFKTSKLNGRTEVLKHSLGPLQSVTDNVDIISPEEVSDDLIGIAFINKFPAQTFITTQLCSISKTRVQNSIFTAQAFQCHLVFQPQKANQDKQPQHVQEQGT